MAYTETPVEEKAENEIVEAPSKVTIEQLQAMNDAELSKLLGLDAELEMFKKKLDEAAGLTGKAREYVEDKITQRLQPDLDARDMGWMIDDAKRMNKTGKEALADASPCSCI